MDLWFRSQDKEELIKIKHLVLVEEDVRGVIDDEYFVMLGTYKTKERALEILDEIQKMDFGNNPNVKLTTYGYVYEMPNE